MAGSLTTEQTRRYDEGGVAFPIDIMSTDEATSFCAEANRLEELLGGRPKPTSLGQLHMHFEWAFDLACHPKVLDAVESVLGENIIAWSTALFPKHPRDPSYISWHQDGTYWNLDSTKVTTSWLALSDSLPENGCMRVVEGSHQHGIHQHHDTYAEQNGLSRGQEIQVEVAEEDATDVILRAGQMSLHHVRIIHGSNANDSDLKRVGFVCRYVTPECQQHGARPAGVLVRGVDNFGHFDLVERPQHASIEEAVSAQQQAAERQLASVMQDAKPK